MTSHATLALIRLYTRYFGFVTIFPLFRTIVNLVNSPGIVGRYKNAKIAMIAKIAII